VKSGSYLVGAVNRKRSVLFYVLTLIAGELMY
jgi:hypothetical protein